MSNQSEFGIKSLSTGYYTGTSLQNSQKIKFKNYLEKENLSKPLNKTSLNPSLIKKSQFEITALGQIQKLEKDIKNLNDEMLSKTKDAIFIKNEVKKSLVSNKNPSTRNIINHYVDKLKSNILNVFDEKNKQNLFLQQKIDFMKKENCEIKGKILELKSIVSDLEIKYGI